MKKVLRASAEPVVLVPLNALVPIMATYMDRIVHVGSVCPLYSRFCTISVITFSLYPH